MVDFKLLYNMKKRCVDESMAQAEVWRESANEYRRVWLSRENKTRLVMTSWIDIVQSWHWQYTDTEVESCGMVGLANQPQRKTINSWIVNIIMLF